METAKRTTKAAPAKTSTKSTPTSAKPAISAIKPVKDALNKTTLTALLAEQSGVEPEAVKAVLAALEAAVLGSVHKKGAGELTLPGLLKIGVLKVSAKAKRKRIDPFTKQEREFAAKPATVKIKVRSLKKLKDAAL